MMRLIITDDEGQEIEVPFLRDRITIGRKEGNTIRLTDRNISRHHAVLSLEGEVVYVEDLDSYNGVILNGNRIGRRTTLYPNDLIELGDYKIRLAESDDPPRGKVDLDPSVLMAARRQLEKDEEPPLGYEEIPSTVALNRQAVQSDERVDSTPTKEPLLRVPPVLAAPKPSPRVVAVEDLQALTDEPSPFRKLPRLEEPPPVEPEPRSPTPPQGLPVVKESEAVESVPSAPPIDRVEIDQPIDRTGKLSVNATAAPSGVLHSEPVVSETMPPVSEDVFDEPYSRDVLPLRALLAVAILAAVVLAVLAVMLQSRPMVPDNAEPDLVAVPDGVPPVPIRELEQSRRDDKRAQAVVVDSMERRKAELSENARQAAEVEERLESKLVQAALAEARVRIGEREWKAAEDLITSVMEDVPDAVELRKLRDYVRRERGNKGSYQQGVKALAKNDFFQAMSLFGGIDADSVYAADARRNQEVTQQKLVRSYTGKGWVAYRKGRYEEAYGWAEKALALLPEDKDGKQLKKAAGIKQREQANAVSAKAPTPEIPSMSARQHYQAGRDFYKKKQYSNAIKHFKQAVEIDRQYANAYRGLGVCYALTRETALAVKAYTRYLDVSPDAPDADQVRQILQGYRESKTP